MFCSCKNGFIPVVFSVLYYGTLFEILAKQVMDNATLLLLSDTTFKSEKLFLK